MNIKLPDSSYEQQYYILSQIEYDREVSEYACKMIPLCVNQGITVGKSGESGKLLPWKFDNLEGNYDFSHKIWWETCLKCNYLPGKFTFFPALQGILF